MVWITAVGYGTISSPSLGSLCHTSINFISSVYTSWPLVTFCTQLSLPSHLTSTDLNTHSMGPTTTHPNPCFIPSLHVQEAISLDWTSVGQCHLFEVKLLPLRRWWLLPDCCVSSDLCIGTLCGSDYSLISLRRWPQKYQPFTFTADVLLVQLVIPSPSQFCFVYVSKTLSEFAIRNSGTWGWHNIFIIKILIKKTLLLLIRI